MKVYSTKFKYGDEVKVIDGPHRERVGTIIDYTRGTPQIKFPDMFFKGHSEFEHVEEEDLRFVEKSKEPKEEYPEIKECTDRYLLRNEPNWLQKILGLPMYRVIPKNDYKTINRYERAKSVKKSVDKIKEITKK